MKRKSTNFLLALIIACWALPMNGLSQTKKEQIRSHADKEIEQRDAFWKTHPEVYKQYVDQQKIQERMIEQLKASQFRDVTVEDNKIIIPVVFHVFGKMQGGKEVNYRLVEDALRRTSEDYAQQSVGQDKIHERFKDIVGMLPVEFRLAKIDPDGNLCSGVTFHPEQSGLGNGGGYDAEIQKYAWDNYKYANVYIMNDLYDDGSVNNSGVAWKPNKWMSDNNLARVCFNGVYLGDNGDENFRRILSHEFGHFFNLDHPFIGGCPEVDGGDHCADTPVADKSQMGVDELNCKGEYTNTQNIMNYTDDYEMFTKDQVIRMTAALNSPSRVTLWQNDNLIATGVNDDFDPKNIVTYASYEITEALVNDGSVDSEIEAVLTEVTDVEFKDETFVLGTHFKVLNLPNGLIPVFTRTSATEVKITFNGKASSHDKSSSVQDITFEFLPAAFSEPIDEVWNYKVNKFSFRFRNEYETKYITLDNVQVDDGNTFQWFYLGEVNAEYGAWRCDISALPDVKFKFETYNKAVICKEGTNELVPLNYGDEISSESNWFAFETYPDQPTVYSKDYTDWLGKRAYIGVQFSADGDIYNGWMSASVSADGNTFTVHDAAYYTKPNATILAGQAHESALKFNGDTLREDPVNNNGRLENFLSAKLMNSTFTVAENTVLTAGTHYSITGLPAGFTQEIKVLPNDYLHIKFNGYAENHNKVDLTKVNITFFDDLFDGLEASEIKNAVNFDINIKYIDEYNIVYYDMDDITVDKVETWEKFTLGESENSFGAWYHEGNLRFETYERDVIGHEGMLDAKMLTKGTSIDSNADVWVTPGAFPEEMFITDTNHREWVGNEGYLGCVINLNGNRCYAWIRLEVAADGQSYTVKDWAYNEQPNALIIAGETIKNTNAKISVKNPEFVELYSNDGAVNGLASINLLNDEFTLEKGAELTQGTHFAVQNIPAGLRCKITVVDANNLTVSLEGKALNNVKSEGGAISITLKDILFRTNISDRVENTTFDLKVKFKGPWDIIYTDLGGITANEDNAFKWFGSKHTSHGFGAWWYNKDGRMKLETYENYIICSPGTSNLIPLSAGTLIGTNSNEWYQGKEWPDEPDLDNNTFHEWLGKEAYVGVRMKNGEYNHFGWIRISVAADAMSYTVLDYAYNDEPEAPIKAGQKLTGDKAILDATIEAFKETYENDGNFDGKNFITVTNAKFSQSSGNLILGTHYSVENFPEGLNLEVSAISSDSLQVVIEGNAPSHLSSDNVDFTITLKEAIFANKTLDKVEYNESTFSLDYRDVYKVVYVDNEDVVCTKDNDWTNIDIIPGLTGVGPYCENNTYFKMEYYDNKLIRNEGTLQVKLLESNVIIDVNTAGWTDPNPASSYYNQLDVCNNSYTDLRGKEGYVGLQLNHKGYFFYAWVRISVAADGSSYQVLDFAYNEKPNEAIFTGAKQFIPIKPEVDFSANKSSIFQLESVSFQDLTTYEPTSWNWTLEGGQPLSSTDQNPVINYVEKGVYDVSLTATNKDGDATLTKSKFITVYEEGPAIANFTANKTTVKTGGQITFSDASLRIPTSWKWIFEGGTPATSTEINPVVTYDTKGTHSVTLIVENTFGLGQKIEEAFIHVMDFSSEGYCEARNTNLDGNWLNISRVKLEGIDNESELAEYSDFTNQVADLTSGESYGMSVSYGTNGWSPNSLFIWIDWDQNKTFEESERVFFERNEDEDGLANFQVPVPSDAKAGLTLMRLRTAYSDNCDPCGITTSAGETEDYTIQVSAPTVPVANFITDKTTIVKGGSVLFSDASENKATSWAWEFESAETLTSDKASLYVQYNTAGTYQVKLTATNAIGSDIKTMPAYITVTETAEVPSPAFSTDVTALNSGDVVGFVNLTDYNKDATYLWTFEGGEPATSTEVNPKVSYYFQGAYSVSLSVTTLEGTETVTTEDLIKVSEAHKPVAEFKADRYSLYEGESIQFTDLSGNEPTAWSWEFEGAKTTVSSDQNPLVMYETAGVYKVKLTASNDLGISYEEKVSYITVKSSVFTPPTGYCTASNVFEGNWLPITNVTLGEINNTSELSEYSDFSNQRANLNMGNAYPMSITYGNNWGPNTVFVWIDWNQNQTFEESELVRTANCEDGDSVDSFDLTIPADAILGHTLMRIRTAYSASSNPCGLKEYAGEVEDYTINVTDIAPDPHFVSFTVTNTELEKGKSIIFSDKSEADAISWAWEFTGASPAESTEQNPLVSYENAGSYSVKLTVNYADGSNSVTKADYISVTEPAANHTPLNISLSSNTIAEDAESLTAIGDFKAVDEDVADTHTFSFVDGDGTNDADNALFSIDGSSLQLNTVLDFETKSEYAIYVQAKDKLGETVEIAFKVHVADVYENMAPTNISLSALSIDENLTAPVLVADLSVEDIDTEDSHTFELVAADGLVDADNTKFSIKGTKLSAITSFDFETKSELKINLKVSDDKGNSFTKAFVISVNDIFENSNPTAISLSKSSITENAEAGVFLATISTEDIDAGEKFTFELVDEAGKVSTDNGKFEIRDNELFTNAIFDFETSEVLNICIKVTDKHEGTFVQEFTISVIDVDENKKPTDILLSKYTLKSDESLSTVVADLEAIDADESDEHSFRLYPANGVIDADNAKFIVEDNYLKLNADISSLTGKLYLNLRTIDKAGAVYTKAIQLEIEKPNTAPTGIELSNAAVSEDAALETVIGTLSAVDADNNDTHTFAFATGGVDNASFTIGGASLKLNAALDFETKTSYSIKVKATDAAGASVEQEFTINVSDVDENLAPTGIELSNATVSEDASLETVIGTLSAVDADNNDTHTFAFATGGVDNASFTIAGASLKLDAALDFETKTSYSIKVKATDAAGASVEQEFTINVSDVDENLAPTGIELSNATVSEDASLETVIGTLSAVDADKNDSHTFAFATGGVDNASFTIVGTSLKLNTALDFESKTSYSIKVKATDAAGASVEQEFTINVSDVDENLAPTGIELSNATVSEDAAVGTVIGSFSAVDADKSNVHTFELVTGGADNASFTIVGTSLKLNTALDFETKTSYSIKVKVADAAGASFEKVFTIQVTDVDENHAPSDVMLSNTSISEEEALSAIIGTLSAVDVDASDIHTFELVTDEADNDSFGIEGENLILNTELDFETKSSYRILVKVSDEAGASFEKEFEISVMISTGIEPILETELQLYPNPVVNNLKVRCDGIKSVKVFNVIGKLVLVSNNVSGLLEMNLNFSDLKSGLYLVRIELNNNEVITKKIVK
ncbi:cadherin domain-containing protein [Ancylomarina sp. YFZ004]